MESVREDLDQRVAAAKAEDEEYQALLRRVLEHRSRRGMNLIEIMIVVAIIVILIAILSVGAFFAWRQFQWSRAGIQMGQIATAVNSVQFTTGKVPQSLDDITCKGGEAFGECLSESLVIDPWGNKFMYEAPGPNGAPFDIVSYGSDGVQGGTGTGTDIRYSDQGS